MNLIEKNNLVDEAYNQILQMILSGDWKEGEKLPSENELTKIMGISRSTVRAAMSKLNALGMVETRQGYGYCLRNLNTGIYLNTLLPTMLLKSKDIESVIEFRIGVESETAALAAIRATEDDIEQIRLSCEKADEARGDPDSFAKYDMAFHRAVANASKNPLFIKTAEMLETMYTVWLMGLLRNHGMERSNVFHHQIYQAVANHNSEEARRYMTEHLMDVLMKTRKDSDKKASFAQAKNIATKGEGGDLA